jgi:type VI secretion system protein ImpJ
MSALRWVLAVRSPLRPADLAKRVPQMGKLCSAKFVMELVKRAFPGMRLEHLDIPPAGIPFEPGTQ